MTAQEEARHYERLAEQTRNTEVSMYYRKRAQRLRKSAVLSERRDQTAAVTKRHLAELRSPGVPVTGAEIEYVLEEKK